MQQSFARRHWRGILNLVTLVAMVVLIIAVHKQVGATFQNLGKVHASLLLLIIPVELLNYHAQAKLYQRLFGIVGNKLPYRFLYRASLELNFVNHVFPSGGVTGLSYFSLRMKKDEAITGAKATLIHVIKLGLTFLSFELVLLFGLLSLAIMGSVSNIMVLVAAWISGAMVFGTASFIFIVGSQRRINGFFTAVTRALNRLIRLVRPRHPETISIEGARRVFTDFHGNYLEIRQHLGELKAPFWYALLANVTEVLAVYVVYLAFGEFVNIGAIIIAYAVANFAGLVSVLPGGVGIYEALMTAVLAAAGIPAGVSLPVTVMYRIVNTAIQVPPGYYLYHKAIKSGEQPPVERNEH